MMLPATLSSMEMLRRPPPARGRPRKRRIALGTAGSRACSCPPLFAWPRTRACADPGPSPHHADHVQGTVSVPVAASVEAMSEHLGGGGFYGRYSTKAGQGSLAPQPLGIVLKATIKSVAACSVPTAGRASNSE